jgi:hypothetical protein
MVNYITKQEAKKLYNNGVDVLIGGHDYEGSGAFWRMSQFIGKPNEFGWDITTFNDVVRLCRRRYCRGVGRLLGIEFKTAI